MEHLLNVYATRSAKGAIADFVGYVEVRESEATMRLTQGLWLVSGASLSVFFWTKFVCNALEWRCAKARPPCASRRACGW